VLPRTIDASNMVVIPDEQDDEDQDTDEEREQQGEQQQQQAEWTVFTGGEAGGQDSERESVTSELPLPPPLTKEGGPETGRGAAPGTGDWSEMFDLLAVMQSRGLLSAAEEEKVMDALIMEDSAMLKSHRQYKRDGDIPRLAASWKGSV